MDGEPTKMAKLLRTLALLVVVGPLVSCRVLPRTAVGSPGDAAQSALGGDDRPIPTHIVARAAGRIKVDGHLDERAWRRAEAIDLVLAGTAEPSPLKTTVKLLWDDQYLYAGFYCEDPDAWTRHLEEDGTLWIDDVVELFIDPAGRGCAYYEYEVNPVNAKLDLIAIHAGRESSVVHPRVWMAWDFAGARNAVYVKGDGKNVGTDDEYWTVEIALPLAEFWGAPNLPPQHGDVWRLNAYRVDRGKPGTREDDLYLATSPTYGLFHRPWRFGRIVFHRGWPNTLKQAR